MENEKYGIVLEAKTNLFKKGMQEAINYTKEFGKGVKESFSSEVIKTARNWRSAIKEAFTDDGYKKELEELKKRYEETSKMQSYAGKEEDISYYESEIARVQELIDKEDKRNEAQTEYNQELEQTNAISSKTSFSLGSLFDKSINKIKRFSFYLLGARSVFSMFMKYQGIYYQYNEKMQYQSELSQNAIALSLAPAFEFLGNVIAYASIGFAKFIELLTGVNVLTKVSTKGIRDYNKGLKESQSLLSGIDEITNLTLPSSTGLASQYQALDDFQKKVKEVEKFFAENKWITDLANGLKKVWEWIGKIYDYIKRHWDVFKYILGAVAVAGIFGSGNALLKISILGLASFITFITALEDYNKAKAEYDKNNKKTHDLIMNNFSEMTSFLLNDTKKALQGVEKGTEQWKKRTDDVKAQLPSILNEIRNGKLSYEEYKPVIDEWINELEALDGETFKPEIDFLTKLNGDDDDIELIKAYYATGNPNSKLTTLGGGTNGFGGGGSGSRGPTLSYNVKVEKTEAEKILEDFKKQGFTIQGGVKLTLKDAKTKLENLLNALDTFKGTGVFTNFVTAPIKKALARLGYAKGLDYVPYDNYPALLHKGEAVVPAKYNTTIHSVGNEYTNSLLETLVMKIDDLAQRPNVFEIDGQKFANATYNLYDNARSRQNYVEGVVR